MWTTGSGWSSRMPTVSSRPSTNCSTSSSPPKRRASAIAAGAAAASRTMWTPTLDPSRGGLTTNGGGIAGRAGPAEQSSSSNAGVGTPAARKRRLAASLSNASRLLATPAPV